MKRILWILFLVLWSEQFSSCAIYTQKEIGMMKVPIRDGKSAKYYPSVYEIPNSDEPEDVSYQDVLSRHSSTMPNLHLYSTSNVYIGNKGAFMMPVSVVGTKSTDASHYQMNQKTYDSLASVKSKQKENPFLIKINDFRSTYENQLIQTNKEKP